MLCDISSSNLIRRDLLQQGGCKIKYPLGSTGLVCSSLSCVYCEQTLLPLLYLMHTTNKDLDVAFDTIWAKNTISSVHFSHSVMSDSL